MTSKHYHHGDLREALINAGEAVLQDRGFAGFTLRECARRAGVSHAAPKHHFSDARHLLAAIAARGFTRLHDALQGALARAQSPDDEMVAATRTYAAFAMGHAALFRLMFRRDLVHEQDDRLKQAAAQTYLVLTNVIRRQRNEAPLTPDGFEQGLKSRALQRDILLCWSHIHGLANLMLEDHLQMVPPGEIDALIEDNAVRLGRLIHDSPG